MQELLNVSDNDRNETWEDQFLFCLTQTKVKLLSEDPQYGPDGWPYLFLTTTIETDKIQSPVEEMQKILHWLSEKGIGAVINPGKEYPDFILSYGMIWNFRETGRFLARSERKEALQTGDEVRILAHGEPSKEFFPEYARKILREFFREQSVFYPKVLMISPDKKNYELAFSVESLGSPTQAEWGGVAEAISWFLPNHVSIVIVSEKGLPEFFLL